jgi:ribosomal protein S13
MAAEENGDEPKLTVKLRSEIIEPEPFEYTILKPAELIVEPDNEESTIELEPEQITIEPEDEEERFEEKMGSVDIPKVQERKPQREKARKSKIMTGPSEPKSISRLHVELRKHSDARKKTDSAILDIRKELKDLLLIHHSTIKDLQKQMTQMRRKIVTIENSRKSTKLKISGKKTSTNKKSKKKTNKKKNKKR